MVKPSEANLVNKQGVVSGKRSSYESVMFENSCECRSFEILGVCKFIQRDISYFRWYEIS